MRDGATGRVHGKTFPSLDKQLEGLYRTEVMEQLNNLMNRNNYFINTMSPVNAVFMQRLAIQYTNEARNKKIITTHEKQVS